MNEIWVVGVVGVVGSMATLVPPLMYISVFTILLIWAINVRLISPAGPPAFTAYIMVVTLYLHPPCYRLFRLHHCQLYYMTRTRELDTVQ